MIIGIVGSGVVGSATGRVLVKLGNRVIFYDKDKNKLGSLKKEGYDITEDIKELVDLSEIIFVCVPTPTINEKIDLKFVENVVKEIALCSTNGKGYFVLVIKSTVLPTTTEKLVYLFENYSGKEAGKDFGVCFNPEFLREKHAYEDFLNPDRIIIGEYDKKSGDLLEKMYKVFNCPIIRTNLRSAEMIKYVNNVFYAAKISFFNEIHMLCNSLNIDSHLIRNAVQMDRYYATHPWNHGSSFGGKCLPKDLQALISFSYLIGHQPILLEAIKKVNEKISEPKGEKIPNEILMRQWISRIKTGR